MNTVYFRKPTEQETFKATKWTRKRMAKSGRKNQDTKDGSASEQSGNFDIYYRYVDIKSTTDDECFNTVLDDEAGSILTTKKNNRSQKTPANPVFMRGAGSRYGIPNIVVCPRPRDVSVSADDMSSESVLSVVSHNTTSDNNNSTGSLLVAPNANSYCEDDSHLLPATNQLDDGSLQCVQYFGKLPSEITPEDVAHLSKEDVAMIPKSVKDSVFSNLASIRAVRRTKPRLNIAFDTEYCYPNGNDKPRAILSYQFACFLSDEQTVLEVSFVTNNPVPENRLSLSTCLGYVIELLDDASFTSFRYSVGRTYNITYDVVKDDGSVENVKRVFSSQEDAEAFLESDEFKELHLMVTLDKSNIKSYCNLRQFTSKAFDICVVCHTGSVDLTAFANDKFSFWKKSGSIIPYLKSVQGGAVSLDDYYLPISKGSEPWKFYPVNITFRDTMCYAPAKACSLDALGKSVGVSKIKLAPTKDEEKSIKSDMLTYMRNHFDDFLSYGAEDSLVTLLYGSKLWGINKDWCITSTSGSTAVVKNVICNYMGIPKNSNGNFDNTIFDKMFRGLEKVSCGMEETAYGFRKKSETRCVSSDRDNLYRYASKAFCGGFNMSSIIGVYKDLLTWDYDLCNAYPTGLCCIADIDYDNPNGCIERTFFNEPLTIGAFHSPADPLFAVVDFEFPDEVAFPCIAIHCDGTVTFPKKGTDVYASGPSLYLALQLGAKIHIRSGFLAKVRYIGNMQKSFSVRQAMKQLVNDRVITKKLFGRGSLEDNLIKDFSNSSYGKIAQAVKEKNTWDGWSEHMSELGLSSITCPETACLVTDIVRCMLIGTANELVNVGYHIFSATTDGFITDSTLEALNRCENFGFRRMFEQCRLFLSDGQDPTIWEVKHAQEFLLNTTTRCNTGFGYMEYPGVNAHGGYKTQFDEDTLEDRREMFRIITQRTGSVTMSYTKFASLKEMQKEKCDFHTSTEEKKLRFNFDMKRKPVKESFKEVSGTFLGIEYKYVNFETVPFEDVEEFLKYRAVSNGFPCLRTMKDWSLFWQRLADKEDGTRHNLSNMEWTKLFAVVAGYRAGMWSIPGLDSCVTVKDKLAYINERNHSGKAFTENNWKDCRKPERQRAAIYENLDDLLEEFGMVS